MWEGTGIDKIRQAVQNLIFQLSDLAAEWILTLWWSIPHSVLVCNYSRYFVIPTRFQEEKKLALGIQRLLHLTPQSFPLPRYLKRFSFYSLEPATLFYPPTLNEFSCYCIHSHLCHIIFFFQFLVCATFQYSMHK